MIDCTDCRTYFIYSAVFSPALVPLNEENPVTWITGRAMYSAVTSRRSNDLRIGAGQLHDYQPRKVPRQGSEHRKNRVIWPGARGGET